VEEPEEEDAEKLLSELLALDPQVSKKDYYYAEKNFWDLEALKDDLHIAKSKAKGITDEEARSTFLESSGSGEDQEVAEVGAGEKNTSSKEEEEEEYDTEGLNPEDIFNWTDEEAFNETGPSLVERRLMGRPNKFQDVTRFIGIDPMLWMKGTVTATHSFGAFAEVFPPNGGEEMIGFLHAARIRPGFLETRENVEKEFWVGKEITVRIVYVDDEQQRLALTMLENEDHLE